MISLFDFRPIQKIFQQAVADESLKYRSVKSHQQHTIESLPAALKNYLMHCGYTVDNRSSYCHIKWNYAHLKMAPGKKWSVLKCHQVNFLPDPARIVLFETKLFGIIPFGAIDSYQAGKGNMLIKLLSYFTVANSRGRKMDIAELVTILAEAILVPAYFLQPYIQWEEINPYTLRGTINYHGLKASGIFYFNSNFVIEKFETTDRCYTDKKGKFHPVRWTAECSGYTRHGEISFPTTFKSTWNFQTGDFTYFQGQINTIIINP